jgi:hypothetical protein
LPSDRDQLLDRVYRRADHLWWRRRGLAVGAALLVVVIATLPFALRDSDTGRIHVATEPVPEVTTTTTTEPEVTTTELTAGPTTTALVCRNSTNPACGPFRWDPEPAANQPLTADVTYTPTNPKVGDEVTFTVQAVDPDASPVSDHCDFAGSEPAVQFGEKGYVAGCPLALCTPSDQYGAWTPPKPVRTEKSFVYRHTYMAGGNFDMTAQLFSGPGGCSNYPYGNNARVLAKVTVVDPSATTTSVDATTSTTRLLGP